MRGTLTLGLFPQKRQCEPDAFFRIGCSDVVGVAADHGETRIRNQPLVGSRLLDRMHLRLIAGNHQCWRHDSLKDSFFCQVKIRHGFVEAGRSLAIRCGEDLIPVVNHVLRDLGSQPVALGNGRGVLDVNRHHGTAGHDK